jgi:hypothetical protein
MFRFYRKFRARSADNREAGIRQVLSGDLLLHDDQLGGPGPMNCTQCAAPIDGAPRFCPVCGQPVALLLAAVGHRAELVGAASDAPAAAPASVPLAAPASVPAARAGSPRGGGAAAAPVAKPASRMGTWIVLGVLAVVLLVAVIAAVG